MSHEHFRRCHGSLVALLDHAAGLGISADVRDQTGFWAQRNWETALAAVEEMNAVVAGLAAELGVRTDGSPLRAVTPVQAHPDYPGLAGSGHWREVFAKLLRRPPLH